MKQTIQNLKGFRDFLPSDVHKRQWLRDKMSKICESWGYKPLETPTLEPLELFTGQIGEDEKLFFSFTDKGGREVALRYDQTVPTCRFLGQYYDKLVFPFRRYQVQPAFRAEKPQKGRYREFLQFDIDIFGIESPLADAEIIALSLDIYKQLGFKKVKALVNNRDLMKGIPYEAISSIDKLKKIGEEGVINDMIKKGISQEQAKQYFYKVTNLKEDETIKSIFSYLKSSGFPSDWYAFEPTLARSFSYSEGPIWEIIIPDYGAGSVAGGERYDGLIEKITGRKIAGTGLGIGFDRTLEALEICNLIPNLSTDISILVTSFSEDLFNKSINIFNKLRENKIQSEIYPDPSIKLDKQLKYADKKNILLAIIIGPDEEKNNKVLVKNMKTREQKELDENELINYLKSLVNN